MSGWGCPHEVSGTCARVQGRACDPGMKGCILFGRFVWSNEAKNRPAKPARRGAAETAPGRGTDGKAEECKDEERKAEERKV
jgi:hypothetical protein